MAVKDGLGPRPVSQTAKRHFLNRLETSSKSVQKVVQNESRLQEDTSRVAVGSAETQEKSRFGASF